MGLFGDIVRSRRIADPIRGSARVLERQEYLGQAASQSCEMQLEVTPDGGQPYALTYRTVVGMTHWPEPGQVVPVTIDRGHRNRLRIEWDEVKPHRVHVGVAPEAVQPAPPPAPAPPPIAAPAPAPVAEPDVVSPLPGQPAVLVPEPLPAPIPAPAPAAEPEGDDGIDARLERLERLAKLHEAGVLTDAELEAEKRRVLGG